MVSTSTRYISSHVLVESGRIIEEIILSVNSKHYKKLFSHGLRLMLSKMQPMQENCAIGKKKRLQD